MESSMIFRIIQKFGAVAALVAYQAAGPAFLPAAQNRVYFDRISLESGLSQSIVTALYQDRQGFLWLGTPDGLFRYDGYEFTPCRFESNNSRSLSNNYVRSILEDRRGRFWIGTMDGLNLFDRAKGTFRTFKPDPADPKSLSDKQVSTIFEDRSGNIWFGTGSGLNRLAPADDPSSFSFLRYEYVPEPGQKKWERLEVFSLLEDRLGRLWVGTLPYGLMTLAGQPLRLSRVFPVRQSNPEDAIGIFCLFEDSRGGLWMGGDHGLQRFAVIPESRPNVAVEQVYPRTTLPRDSTRFIVYDIVEDAGGKLWIGTYGQGLLRLDLKSGEAESLLNDPGDPASLSNNYILALCLDRTGTMWAGTSGGGLNKRNTTKERIRHFACSPQDPLAANRNMIFAILEDGPGRYLLGTRDGLCVLGLEGSSYGLWNDGRVPDPLKHEFIRFLRRDRGGRIWVGTVGQQSGLFRFDPASGRFDQFLRQRNRFDSLGQNTLTSAAIDPAGNLWIGTFYNGLDRIAAEDLGKPAPAFRHYRRTPASPSSLSHNNISVVLADSTGTIWIGTQGAGLNRLSPSESTRDNPSFLVYRNAPDNPTSLSDDNVISLFEDRAGRLWVGTARGGLNLFEPAKGSFRRYTTKNGLPDDTIYSIIEDGDGNIWVGTNAGLAKMNTESFLIMAYDTQDGLQGNEFNTGAAFRNGAGELLFGGINGLNIIRAGTSESDRSAPVVAITYVSVAEKEKDEVVPAGLRLPIFDAASIRLPYRNAGFKARFGLLDFRAPRKNSIICRIGELGREWTLRNGEHHLDAPALDAGRYTLEVLGVNADGVRSERPARLSVEVASPYWKTAAFYLVLLLLAGAGGAASLVVRKKLNAARLPAEIDFVPFMEKYGLSQREREIFVLLMQGRKNKDIAGELFISENTVKVHVYNIYRKLGVNSRLGILEMLRRR